MVTWFYHRVLDTARRFRWTVIALSDDPVGNARALAAGALLTVIPGLVVGLVLALAAWVFKGHRLALITGAFLLNPYTIPPFYYAAYHTGCRVLSQKPLATEDLKAHMSFQPVPDMSEYRFLLEHLQTFGVGLVLLGAVLAVVVYVVSLPLLSGWRRVRLKKEDGQFSEETV